MKAILYNTLIYLALMLGYLFLYHFNVEQLIYPEQEIEIESTVDFIYQQF